MARPSARPVSTRVKSRSVGKATSSTTKSAKALPPLNLPEDDDDFRPAKRGKIRSKEQNQKASSKKREKFDDIDDLTDVAQQFLEDMEDVEDPKNAKKLVSTFQKGFEKTRKAMADGVDIPAEQAASDFYRVARDMVMDLIPVAESNYRLTGKEGANYALQALVNQGRDLMNDVKLSEDIESKLIIVRQLIRSSFRAAASLLITQKFDFHRQIDGVTVDPRIRKAVRAEMDKSVIAYSKGLDEFQNHLSTQISMYLLGDPNYLNPRTGMDDEMETDAPKKRGRKKKKKK